MGQRVSRARTYSARAHLCLARITMVFGLAVAAFASCQRFKGPDEPQLAAPAQQFEAYDACIGRGGRWLVQGFRCEEPAIAQVRDSVAVEQADTLGR